MARIRPVLGALRKVWSRSSSNLRAVAGNNMTYLGITLTFMMAPSALLLFGVLIGLVLFLPSSGDPFALIPRDRLELWPLTVRERRVLRWIAPWLNPIAWLVLAGLLWKRVTMGLWAFVAAFFFAGFIGSYSGLRVRVVPPAGPALVRLHLRQMACTLDVYCALLLALPSLCFRFAGSLPADAHLPLTMLILVVLSTIALTLFGMDGWMGMARYRLLPMAGWRILLTKGASFLAVLVLFTLHLAPFAAFGGGLMALAVGNFQSVKNPVPQGRWRLRAGNAFAMSILQMVLMLLAAGSIDRWRRSAIFVCAAAYAISLWWCGRKLERMAIQ